jgi:predicted N-formylglutamate amidohydrolase
MGVARCLSARLDAALVAGTVSRLVYDCNRPPSSPDAMPSRSELIDIPGNVGLSEIDRSTRTKTYYEPFRKTLAGHIQRTDRPIVITIHSFTPVYHGQPRAVEIGVLHDADARLADAMLETAQTHTTLLVERNQPYGPQNGVTHTLKEHALPGGHLNVMLEIRNDLIRTDEEQDKIAATLAAWLTEAFTKTGALGVISV